MKKWTKTIIKILAVVTLALGSGMQAHKVYADDPEIFWGAQAEYTWDSGFTQQISRYGAKINFIMADTQPSDDGKYHNIISIGLYQKNIGELNISGESATSVFQKWSAETPITIRIRIQRNGKYELIDVNHTPGTWYAYTNPITETITQINANIVYAEESITAQNITSAEVVNISGPSRATAINLGHVQLAGNSEGSSVWTQEQITTLMEKLDSIQNAIEGTESTTGQQQTVTEIAEKSEDLAESATQITEQETELLTSAKTGIDAIDPEETVTNLPAGLLSAFEWVRNIHSETVERTELPVYIGIVMLLGLGVYILGRK